MNRQQSGHVSWICIKATLDDFNGDNITDLVAPVQAVQYVSVLLGFGNGSFASQITFPTGYWPIDVAIEILIMMKSKILLL